MKTILCYGDSNTWGNVPRSDDRYPKDVRWPGALQNILDNDFDVISEGLCGRTLVAVDPAKLHRTGINDLHAALESADPIDLVIVMLGTNDVKNAYNLDANEIAQDLEEVIVLIKNEKVDLAKEPQVLIVCPPAVIIPSDGNLDERMSRGPELFKVLPGLYKEVAERYGCAFLDAGEYVSSSKIDGYHWDKESHLKFAEVIADKVKELNI